MLCSMANSGCLLVSNSGMLPHSLPCPPAFLYLQQVSDPLLGIFLRSVHTCFLRAKGPELNLFLSSLSWPLRHILPAGTGDFCCGGRSRVSAATSPGASSAFCAKEAAPSRAGERGGGWRGPRRWRCGRQSRRRGSSTCPSSALLLFGRGQGRCSMLCAREPGSSVAWAAPRSGGGGEEFACVHTRVRVCVSVWAVRSRRACL